MHTVNIYEAKTRLSALIQAVDRGEEVVITNRDRPVARFVPVQAARRRPVFGSAKAAFERSGLTRKIDRYASGPLSYLCSPSLPGETRHQL